MTHILFFIYCVICAYFLAKLEINIEGKYGWAEKLPTWRKIINLPILRDHPITGYHFYQFMCFLPMLLQIPFIFIPWTMQAEAKIIAFYIFLMCFEDILWFALNPDFGIRKYNKLGAQWHKNWLLFLPSEMWLMLIVASSLYYWSWQFA